MDAGRIVGIIWTIVVHIRSEKMANIPIGESMDTLVVALGC